MNEHLAKIINHPQRVPIGVGILSFVAGVGVGLGISYIRDRRNAVEWELEEEVYEIPERVEFDQEEMEQFLSQREALVGKEFVEKKLEEEAVIEETTIVPHPEEKPEPEIKNVFAGTDEEWDYDKELKSRSSEEPYILHKDEFYAEELEYTQISLTYYAGDDIMVDEDEAPVYSYQTIVGSLRFGHGSGDPKVVYVRNDKRRAEYEIIRDEGLYSTEVLGLNIEDNQRVKGLRHSNHVPKFKME